MSKQNALEFLNQAAQDEALKGKVKGADNPSEVIGIAQERGYDISQEHVQAAIPDLKQQKGFFGDLVEAILRLFSPDHDDYPATGVQPFSGDPNSSRH
ncbi:bacteriocin [filamentous cyanobacterium CCP5]|nr:bacteriocin [filamentous cyanobacterium CCP5]